MAASEASTTATGSSNATSATTAISFVQVAFATPHPSATTASVAFPKAQTAGDMNIVVVGWNDATATVQSVKDSAGNTYSLAIGPTSGTALRQSIYYAPNIAGVSNTVTVAFNQAAVSPDVRVLEYSGVNALDVTSGASGNSSTASSGAATTTSANELIFGANMVFTSTTGAGSGFTSRVITSPDGDIAEDKVVTTAGSNSASAPLSSSGPWVMQMATFANIPVSSPTAQPQLTVSPASLAFGSVVVGATATLPVTLTSSGTGPVKVNSATISGTGLSVSGATFPLTINPGQTATLNVQSAPMTTGAVTGTLTISSNSSTNPTTVLSLSSTGVTATTPQLTVSSTSLSFGNVAMGSTSTLPLTVTSTGTGAVKITSVSTTGTAFTVSGAAFPLTLNPGQAATLSVKFAPTAASTSTGTLSINSNASRHSATGIVLSGTGVSSAPQLTVSASSLSFGSVAIGSSATQSVTLTSSGTSAVTVNSAGISGTGFSVSGATFPLTLSPKQTATLTVKFAPTAAGAVTGALAISSNSSTNASASVGLSGTGTGTSQWTVSASSLSFGSVGVGSSATQSVTLTSTGTGSLTINSATISGTGFSVSGATFPLTLSPKQTATLTVKFAPTTAAAATGTLAISSNASTNPTASVSLSGTGTSTQSLTLSPTSLTFGSVAVGSNATLGVTLTSNGSASVTVNSATISGTGFSVSGATFPVTLSPNQAVTLTVKFAPTTAGAVTGALAISSNSSTNPSASVSLSGTGTQHQVTLSWQAPSSSSDPVAGYHIYRATGSSSSYTLLNSSVVTQTSYVDTTVAGGTSYIYYVKSVDASGNESGPSNSVSVTIPSP